MKEHNLDNQVLTALKEQTHLNDLALSEDFPQNRVYVSFKHPHFGHRVRVEVNKENIVSIGKQPHLIASYIASLIFNEFPDVAGINQPISNAIKITPGAIQSGPIAFHEAKPIWISEHVKQEAKWLIENKTIPVTISADMTKFAEGMTAVQKQLNEMAKVMAAEWEKAFQAMSPGIEQLNNLVNEVKSKPADYALSHKGMKVLTKCPGAKDTYLPVKSKNNYGLEWVAQKVPCGAFKPLDKLIVHLNDGHMWPREEIADWLDTLDEQPVFYPEIAEEVGA